MPTTEQGQVLAGAGLTVKRQLLEGLNTPMVAWRKVYYNTPRCALQPVGEKVKQHLINGRCASGGLAREQGEDK